jgi:uncharacterized protein (TIGR03437 family)
MINISPASRFVFSIILYLLFVWMFSTGGSSAAFQQQQSTTPRVMQVNPQRDEILPLLPDSTIKSPRSESLIKTLLSTQQASHSTINRRSHSAEGLDHPAEAAEFFRFKRLPAGEKELPVEKYFEAQEEMRQMPQFSTADNRFAPSRAKLKDSPEQQLGAWTPLGPGNIGGRTRALLISPNDPNVMYAAGVAGGVWKSTDAGATWKPIADLIVNIAVNAMAFEPGNANVIYAGTGEGYFNGDGVRGAGIFKTTDGGATWTRLASTATSDFHFVNDIVVSPNDNRRIYAATRTGVWSTTDGGGTWTRTLNPSGIFGGALAGGCLDLAIRTDRITDHVLAACGTFEQAMVYRNTDAAGGGDWTAVLTEPGMGRTALAIAPSNQNVIYALASSIDPNSPFYLALHAVFRSMDGGASWTAQTRNTAANKMNTAILSFPIFAFGTDCGYALGDYFGGQAWYDLTIAVDPADADRVWAGGIDLFRSDDGGVNWGQAGFVYVFETFTPKIHPDQHVIIFHPRFNGSTNQTMFVAGDGGLYRTDNARAAIATDSKVACNPNNAAVKWTAVNNDYGVTQFYHGLPYPDGRSYFGGTQDNGTLAGSDNAGINGWKMINGGDGGYVAIDQSNPNMLYSAYTGISIQKSTDNGATFSRATHGILDFGLFINPYVMDPSDPQRLWTAGYGYIWRTDDGAAHWTQASAPGDDVIIRRPRTSALAVAPTDSNFVVVGSADGAVLFNTEALTANSRSRWLSTRPRDGYVSWVAIDPANKEIVYVTYSTFGGEHVWRSIDGGLTWTAIDGEGDGRLPDIPVHCIVIDPSNTSRLYIGTDLGVFVSTNGGASWAVENTGFANVIVESLSPNVAGGVTTLYAFTHGRGAWRVTANKSGCYYQLSPATRTFGAKGGTAIVNVIATPSGCDWKATSNAPWINVASGSGAVNLKVEENDTVFRRASTVTIGGRSVAVIQDGQPDTIAPEIEIVSPDTNPATVSEGFVNLVGNASDNDAVAAVAWRTNRGAAGVAEMTGLWKVRNLPLAAGDNVITVTALDDAGNTASATITVYAPPSNVLVTVAGTGVLGFSGDNGQAVAADLNYPLSPIFDGAGALYFCDFANHRVRKIAPNGVISTVAGNGLRGYDGDGGPATAARLNLPTALAIDRSGNLYICDWLNHRIRRVDAGTGVITTVAGNGKPGFGGDGGPATAAQLNGPNWVAADGTGNLYIADTYNHRIRRVGASDGKITTIAGTDQAGFSGDGGPAKEAMLNVPNVVIVDGLGDLFIADSGNQRIRKISSGSDLINTIAGNGSSQYDGENVLATRTGIGFISGLAIDGARNLYFCDLSNGRIRRIAASTGLIRTVAGSSVRGLSPDGSAAVGAPLYDPSGAAVDAAGTVHFTEIFNSRIRKILSPVSFDDLAPAARIAAPTTSAFFAASASPLTLSGSATDDRAIVAVRWENDRGGGGEAFGKISWTIPNISLQNGLNNITVTAWDSSGKSGSAHLTVSFSPQQVIVTVAGNGVNGSSGDGGAATAAQLWFPVGVAVDAAGNIYFTDAANHRVRKVTPDGVIRAFAGSGALGSSGDGAPATTASMNSPLGIAVDNAGNVYITDSGNNRVRKVTTGGIITTVAGTGENGFGGDGGPATAAKLSSPFGVALDAANNIYIADTFNARVRKVDARTGVITTVAGTGQLGSTGDGGPATTARFFNPAGVALDAAGNLYISDVGDQRVRRVNASDGRVITVVGNGIPGYNGDDILAAGAQLNAPLFISFDRAGDLFIADQVNHRIRKVAMSTGLITTVAGIGTIGSSGDGSAPAGAQLFFPTGVALDRSGNQYIADQSNHRIRKTLPASALRAVTALSAASFNPETGLANESIATVFGTDLAAATQTANTAPLPITLAGATVSVRDILGVDRLAQLFFAAPNQINFLVPQGTAPGIAAITVTGRNGTISTGAAKIASVAPGLFAANADGKGIAAAVALRVKQDGSQTFEPVVRFDPSTNKYVSAPIDLGPETDQVFLLLFGTGFRHRSASGSVSAQIGGIEASVLYAGAQGGFVGLDQINLRMPRTLIGRGEVTVTVLVDETIANPVSINIK